MLTAEVVRDKGDALVCASGSMDSSHSQFTLMPGSSMVACSLMPMPLRMTRKLPSVRAPLQVTTCVGCVVQHGLTCGHVRHL
jgi:hypothetical protein